MTSQFYVYCWENQLNGKRYIGKGKGTRTHDHVVESRKTRPRSLIAVAMKKHGIENFVLTFLKEDMAEDASFELEQHYTDEWDTIAPNGYNLCRGGRGGSTPSEQTRRKISAATRRGQTPEIRAQFAASRTGKKFPEDRCARMSEVLKGNKRCVGRKLSPATRAKISSSRIRSNKTRAEQAPIQTDGGTQ